MRDLNACALTCTWRIVFFDRDRPFYPNIVDVSSLFVLLSMSRQTKSYFEDIDLGWFLEVVLCVSPARPVADLNFFWYRIKLVHYVKHLPRGRRLKPCYQLPRCRERLIVGLWRRRMSNLNTTRSTSRLVSHSLGSALKLYPCCSSFEYLFFDFLTSKVFVDLAQFSALWKMSK